MGPWLSFSELVLHPHIVSKPAPQLSLTVTRGQRTVMSFIDEEFQWAREHETDMGQAGVGPDQPDLGSSRVPQLVPPLSAQESIMAVGAAGPCVLADQATAKPQPSLPHIYKDTQDCWGCYPKGPDNPGSHPAPVKPGSVALTSLALELPWEPLQQPLSPGGPTHLLL